MKTAAFLVLIIFCELAFSQDADKRGSIRVQKNDSDLHCKASIQGYSGKNTISKNILLKSQKIELNENCNYKIISFELTCTNGRLSNNPSSRGRTNKQSFKGDTFKLIINGKERGKAPFLKLTIDKIRAKNKNTDAEIELPQIIFNVVN